MIKTMREAIVQRTVWIGVAAMGLAVAMSCRAGSPMVLGVLVGGSWQLVNLWSLSRMIARWLEPSASKRRMAGWFVVKFPLLYLLAIISLSRPWISPVGFGMGFVAVLIAAAIASLIPVAASPRGPVSYGG